MTAHAVQRGNRRRRARGMLPFASVVLLLAAAGAFVSYLLWPNWPSEPTPLDGPPLPITVAGVLFEVPPAAIRQAVQRKSGAQQRLDLAFLWPSLAPAQPNDKPAGKIDAATAAAAAVKPENERLFVTIAALGDELPPLDRLKTIYPRYAATEASAGPDGLAILPFRAGTPYDGEDLVYVGTEPERFFATCTRQNGAVPGTCMHERMAGTADLIFRFPRAWFGDWRTIAAGFDRLLARLHPPN